MTTFGTLFSGGELAGIGMQAAGLKHKWGIEIRDDIAQVARSNGFNVITADVLQVDPATMEPVDCLHASPVCTRASNANHSAELNEEGTKEAPLDIAMGEKIAQFIDVLSPRIVTIENVYQYREFKAFKIILAALDRGGYWWDFDNLNAADFGVPQTRRRLVLRAVRGALLPNLPQPEQWIGWHQAIFDIIHTLPESKFAKWQIPKLPKEIVDSLILDCQNAGDPDENGNRSVTIRSGKEPMFTVSSSMSKRPARAWLIAQGGYDGDIVHRADDEPSFTITANNNQQNGVRDWLETGRVVVMTPRALARFQSVPDSYVLPVNNKLACTIIGNGVPPLLMQKIYQGLVGV